MKYLSLNTLFLLLTAIIVSGVFVVMFVVSGRTVTMPNASAPWLQYQRSDGLFTLQYPSDWQYSMENSVVDSTPGEIHTLTLGPKAGFDQASYPFLMSWTDQAFSADCAIAAEQAIQTTLKSHNATLNESIGQSIQKLFEPVQEVKIGKYNACRFPDSTRTEQNITFQEENYGIIHDGTLFSISFPAADAPNEVGSGARENNTIAHRILDSITLK